MMGNRDQLDIVKANVLDALRDCPLDVSGLLACHNGFGHDVVWFALFELYDAGLCAIALTPGGLRFFMPADERQAKYPYVFKNKLFGY